MKNHIKCYHCGKERELGYKEIREVLSCDHCHQKMRIDQKTQKHFRIMRYLFVLVICLVIAFCMSRASASSYLVLLAVMSAALILSLYSDRLCLILTAMTFGVHYEEYHPAVKTNKELRKERKQPKKGLFRK